MLKQFFLILITAVIFTLTSSCSDKTQLQALDENTTILAFGDSLTYGTGTSNDKAYPAVLERLINRKVVNAGIPGEISSKGCENSSSQFRAVDHQTYFCIQNH